MTTTDTSDLSKNEFEQREARLRAELLQAQFDLRQADFPVLVIISGIDAAGRSETIDLFNKWLDVRHLQTFAYRLPSDEERDRPPFWRYWRDLPPRGKIGIYYSGWHLGAVLERAERRMKHGEFKHALALANLFEQQLVDDGALVVKLMFHISREQLHERLRAWEDDPEKSWRVGEKQWRRYKHFDRLKKLHEEDIERTDTPIAPWTLIDGAHPRRRALAAGEELLAALRARLSGHVRQAPSALNKEPSLESSRPELSADALSLADVDLSQAIDKQDYEAQLAQWQGAWNQLSRQAFEHGIPLVAIFEGWDAAGKGGAIRRITSAIDARQYRVVRIGAPTQQERQFHYLWRFWRHLPRRGCFTIFDRSWYGRVLVERVEGFATDAQWGRAYEEINAFENQLVEHGAAVAKFWIEISPDEQLRRFASREQTDYKQYKIGEEDYRNREKWP
ncbi:MAG: polyphosphate:AMP phosphotransferase, partial [Planctomycetales bacterium]|nr:polyphosphate:AMP phosphotransferase [Planctomycetales bacterium]